MAADYNVLADESVFDPSLNVPAGSLAYGVTLSLNPGDVFWIYTLLQTPAGNDAIVQTTSPFTPAWDDPAGLVPALAVPEPGTFALLLTALLGVFARTRRRVFD